MAVRRSRLTRQVPRYWPRDAMKADARRWRSVAIVIALLLAAVVVHDWYTGRPGAGEFDLPMADPVTATSETATPTALDSEAVDFFSQARDVPDGSKVLLVKRGVRVVQPVSVDDDSALECPLDFPVAGLRYGVFYLPKDSAYPQGGDMLWVEVCFASEQDAATNGYQHGSVR